MADGSPLGKPEAVSGYADGWFSNLFKHPSERKDNSARGLGRYAHSYPKFKQPTETPQAAKPKPMPKKKAKKKLPSHISPIARNLYDEGLISYDDIIKQYGKKPKRIEKTAGPLNTAEYRAHVAPHVEPHLIPGTTTGYDFKGNYGYQSPHVAPHVAPHTNQHYAPHDHSRFHGGNNIKIRDSLGWADVGGPSVTPSGQIADWAGTVWLD